MRPQKEEKPYIYDGIAKTFEEWASALGLSKRELVEAAKGHGVRVTEEIKRRWRELGEAQ